MTKAPLVPYGVPVYVSRRRRPTARHRHGSPGLNPYRVMTIDQQTAGRSRRGPARHVRRGARRIAGSRVALICAAGTTATLFLTAAWHAASGAVAVAGMFAP